MKIALCGSMAFKEAMLRMKAALESEGHKAVIPQGARNPPPSDSDRQDEFRLYYDEILASDAILVVNRERRGVPGYIGANTLIELAFAYVLEKTIYLMHPPPPSDSVLPYQDELERLRPFFVLTGNLDAGLSLPKEKESIAENKFAAVREYKQRRLDRIDVAAAKSLQEVLRKCGEA